MADDGEVVLVDERDGLRFFREGEFTTRIVGAAKHEQASSSEPDGQPSSARTVGERRVQRE